jgi:glycosyltransferase involved in cell wall biosynthesis
MLAGIKLYALIFVERDYYRNFNLDPSPYMDKPLRVAMFTNNYLPFIGGVPISIDRLHRGLAALGERVLVVAPRYRRRPPAEPDVLRVPELCAFGDRREFRLANLFSPRIGRRLAAFKPDIVHLHHPFWLGSLGLFLARRLGAPAVYTYHTRLEHYAHFVPLPTPLFRNLISHALIKRFANRCDGVIVPTEASEDYLRIIGVKTDIFVQPTGIDYERFQQVDPSALERLREQYRLGNEPVIVSVSRLSKEKNIDFMLEAVHALRARHDEPFRFLIIGEGDEHSSLQARIDTLQLNDCVTLTGSVEPEEIPVYYRLADAFVFASKSETQGMVILEAMAAGLPVVAVRSSGIDDVVRDDFNGFKTPENLALWHDKVHRLLTDSGLRERLSANARAFAGDYSIDRYAQSIKSIYAHVLAASARSRPEK